MPVETDHRRASSPIDAASGVRRRSAAPSLELGRESFGAQLNIRVWIGVGWPSDQWGMDLASASSERSSSPERSCEGGVLVVLALTVAWLPQTLRG